MSTSWPLGAIVARERVTETVRKVRRQRGSLAAEEIAMAMVAGVIEGAVETLGTQRTYEILQPLLDDVVALYSADERAKRIGR